MIVPAKTPIPYNNLMIVWWKAVVQTAGVNSKIIAFAENQTTQT
jgi:hypothetical protein